jgi:hypothetical protein
MFPRELLDCRLAVAEQDHQLRGAKKTSTMPTHAEKKQGAARIISFKTSQYRRVWPV